MTTRCDPYHCRGDENVPDRRPMFQGWFDKGWNVGSFRWDQFAADSCARDAEQQIWFDRQGNGLQWRSNEFGEMSTHHYLENSAQSIADLCVTSVKGAMAGFSGKHVRFVGHSIGAQLAARCAALLQD